MQIDCIDPLYSPLWRQLVEARRGDVFHSPPWLHVLADTYGFDLAAYVLVTEQGEPVAGVPFCRVADLRGTRLVTLPFSDYCDPLVNTAPQWDALAGQLLCEQIPYTLRCLHNAVPLADSRFTLVNKAKWHGLDLTPELPCLWEHIESGARRAIRKAEQAGVVVRMADSEATLRQFYQMHLAVRKQKYRMLAQPYAFFANIWRHFMEAGQGVLLYATHEDQVIGATMLLEWGDRIYYKFNASTADQLAVRPNDLLIWRALQYAKAKGHTYLDFGLSDWDQEGLVRYKRKFATEEKTIAFLRHQPEHVIPLPGWGNLLPQLTDLFTDESVPDAITAAAGDVLYRYFT